MSPLWGLLRGFNLFVAIIITSLRDFKFRPDSPVERSFEIIGEAMRRILHEDGEIEIRNAKKIVAFRNKISHEYDKLDDETLYSIVITYLPQLKLDVIKILDKHKP